MMLTPLRSSNNSQPLPDEGPRLRHFPGATRRPHICFVAPDIWPVFSGDPDIKMIGGAEVQQCIIARLLARTGYRVSIICLDYGQPSRVTKDGITVIKTYRPDAGIPVLRFLHPRLTGMWQALRRVNADIYYQRSASMLTAIVAAYCRRHGKHAIYAAAADSDFVPGKQEIRFRRDRWLFERGLAAVDAIIVQNEHQKRDCLQHYGRNPTLIPSAYELPAETHPHSGDCALWVGRIDATKRPELLLDLARRLPQRRFVMIGGATHSTSGGQAYFDTIRNAAAELANVDFVGFLPLAQVESYFDRARVFISTSEAEGMPNVFLQAWARGVPTVAMLDIGARLRDKPLYPPINDPDALAQEVERMFSDDIYRARASADCREYFTSTHGSAEILGRYQRLIDELVRDTREPEHPHLGH